MTRKHFELIANAIRVTKNTTEGDDAALRELALNLCVEFKRENGRFNTNRFIEACGLQNWKAGILRDTALVGSTHQSWIASKSYEQ